MQGGTLSPIMILSVIVAYFVMLYLLSVYTARRTDNASWFLAGRRQHWIWIAIGMIGASLSGVTFISIPGVVGTEGLNRDFSYYQVVLGYMLGYALIAFVLMPLYYKLQLTTIYGYLQMRFGYWSYKTGAACFLVSRVIGSAFRLYLVAMILDMFVAGPLGVPLWVTVFISIVLIWIYTRKGGMQTIIYTDVLQTVFMIGAVVLSILIIAQAMEFNAFSWINAVRESPMSKVIFLDGGWSDPNFFFKQFISGALITIVMTGLDQDMMQKNLSCRNLKDAQKNMLTFCVVLLIVNLLFLSLGALLYMFAQYNNIPIPEKTDQLFPMLALQYLPSIVGVLFIVGLVAAAYSSADSAMTALTTSFCVDFLDINEKSESVSFSIRRFVHMGMAVSIFLVIMGFSMIHNKAIITKLFEIAGYTYGPLLGMFTYGVVSKRKVWDKALPFLAILSPLMTWIIHTNSAKWFNGLQLGFLLIAVNGLLMFVMIYLTSFWRHRKEYK